MQGRRSIKLMAVPGLPVGDVDLCNELQDGGDDQEW